MIVPFGESGAGPEFYLPQRRHTAGGPGDPWEAATGELAGALFASLARRDQRQKGEQYLRGLLQARGRKSIRNIAAHVGGPAAEQSLHHFISSSTWDWMPMREALARHLSRAAAPQAWVVGPMPIPKAGDQSVGVEQGYDQCLGQSFHGQQAFGVFYASELLTVPVHWRLFLPGSWLRDDLRRRRAEIPEGIAEETLLECALAAFAESVGSWRVPARPVVLNTYVDRVAATVDRFTAAGLPVVARVSGTSLLEVRDPALPGYGGGPLAAQRILASVKGLRRRSTWGGPTGSGGSLTVAVRVGPTDGSGRARRAGAGDGDRDLLLLGEWTDPDSSPVALWVTNLASAPAGALLRLTKLAGRACRDLTGVGEEVGLRDFEGRSFRGWHRHISLASAAHAATAMAGLGGSPVEYPTPRSA
ncbi:transposase [Kitasatospora sp. NPDC050463]|uniref:IS701 family transposase n=1 Tax=Kitasatospora sp. NPDC050463 TaxID=3155786 RepID=UPI0033E46B49